MHIMIKKTLENMPASGFIDSTSSMCLIIDEYIRISQQGRIQNLGFRSGKIGK